MAWLNPGRWLMLIVAAGAMVLGYFAWADHQQGIGDARATARWTKAVDEQKTKAIKVLAVEVAKVAAVERALADAKNKQELQDAANQKTVAGLSARLRDLAGPAGRLRDPNAAGCGRSSVSADGPVASAPGDRADDYTEASGLLSAQLSGLLQQLGREADDINDAYASCRADAFSVRAMK